MRFRRLSDLESGPVYECTLSALPEQIPIARYALAKAFKISEIVRAIHRDSYEWYGFTLAHRGASELVVDVGLPANAENLLDHAGVSSESIAAFQESLPEDQVINGWIHSHGNLPFERFSLVDEANQSAVLDYVTARLRRPVAKKEIRVRDLTLLVEGRWTEKELEPGSVAVITDVPVGEARIIETVYGGFCYAIVIGDAGWHRQEIHYRRRGILSGRTVEEKREAGIVLAGADRPLGAMEVRALKEEVRARIRPGAAVPHERFEREAT